MEASAVQDEQFMRWILSTTAERFWEFDERGHRIKLKAGWEKAQSEYDRIMGRDSGSNPPKSDGVKMTKARTPSIQGG